MKPLCPDIITVPVGVEAVWALISQKSRNPRNKIQNIAVCSLYYRGPKSTKRKELFDHIAESYHLLTAKYGTDLHFIIAGDTNRLNLSPILNLSPHLKQVVKIPTRLNPDAILDTIITTLSKYYCEPVTKPPINNNEGNGGKPSDHLVVLMYPITSVLECPPRQYRTVEYRPLTDSGMEAYGQWLADQDWNKVYSEIDVHKKADVFQEILMKQFYETFPLKTFKVCSEDKPWITRTLKLMDRKQKREFSKNQNSPKWQNMNQIFEERCAVEKSNYYKNIVKDLKTSKPRQWYSKVKRMSGKEDRQNIITVEELDGFNDEEQAEMIANHYASISNLYKPVNSEDFKDFLDKNSCSKPPNISPYKILKVINKMNRNSATCPGDLPMKIIYMFSDDLVLPLSHIINCCFQAGQYPVLWKNEFVTPVPKVYPPEKMEHLRKISGLLNFSKITDSLLTEFLVADMAPKGDVAQYGNEEGLSVQHYLIKMLHEILTKLDNNNNQSDSFAVLMSMIDWSQAFDRQSHKLGIQSFIDNGARPSLIPILLSFFQERKMQVKWNGRLSSTKNLLGGGPQGGTLGIVEYKSQSNDNTDFLESNEKYKYIDDLSILELVNLILHGISSYNCKQQVPSDIRIGNKFLHNKDFKTQDYLNQISKWTDSKQMKLNCKKSNYMIFNFTRNSQFNTRLYLEDKLLDEKNEARLLGVIVSNNLTWHSNTADLVKRSYQRMLILKKLYQFSIPVEDMVHIYCMYIRSIAEQSSVVWSSSLTKGEEYDLERIQKVALRIIFSNNYITYEHALSVTNLPTLKSRRTQLSLNFALKCTKSPRTQDMFPLRSSTVDTRNPEIYDVTKAKTERLGNSSIPFLQRRLNKHATKSK